MSDKEKLDSLCKDVKDKIKNIQSEKDCQKKWRDFALLGSVQTRKAKFGIHYQF